MIYDNCQPVLEKMEKNSVSYKYRAESAIYSMEKTHLDKQPSSLRRYAYLRTFCKYKKVF
jgi:hypothetical protein